MKFVHLSPEKITKFKTPKNLGHSFKPKGTIWVACQNEWERYLKEELETDLSVYKFKYEVDVDLSNVIILKTVKDIKLFTERFGLDEDHYDDIDWNRIREETGSYGIFIPNPHIKKARLEFGWYSSFDICSIAIWDKRAILSMNESTYPSS